MSQNELLVDVLRRDLGLLKMTVADMSDGDLVQRPVAHANNGLWQLGHLVAAEARIVNDLAGRQVIELPAGFSEKYSRETASVDDPARLGTKDGILAVFEKVRAKTCEWVATLSAADLAAPAPEQMRNFFPTIGHIVHMLPTHAGMHVGQIQVLRRKLGKPILF
jgi:hypothetical protein